MFSLCFASVAIVAALSPCSGLAYQTSESPEYLASLLVLLLTATSAVTMTIQGHVQPADPPVSDALPRTKRRRNRPQSDKGLPPDDDLVSLARDYLIRQRELWPNLIEHGFLPEPTDEVLQSMVADFKHRHRTGDVDALPLAPIRKLVSSMGGSYKRFSCDGSKPTSINDQLLKILPKAKDKNAFIPWAYVFADYSVSGLDNDRVGYASYKRVLADKCQFISVTFIDDFTRASRDWIEWFSLAQLIRRLHKRLYGASDGFDLNSPEAEMMLDMYALVSRVFIRSLRQKVKRGQAGAMRRGTVLGKLGLGYTRIPKLEGGRVVCGSDGLPIHAICIDPETSKLVLQIYDWFVNKKYSMFRIVKHFNQHRIDQWDGWNFCAISGILSNPAYIGCFTWNKHRRELISEERDGRTETKIVRVKNPRSEWQVYYNPALAIVPLEMWRASRRRLAELRRKNPHTGKVRSRNSACATTLFSATLFCGYCGRELTLRRSAGKNKTMHCHHGTTGNKGCQLNTGKAVPIIEKCLLGFLRDELLSERSIEEWVASANRFLAEESRRPRTDTEPLKARVKELDKKADRLVRHVEDEDDPAKRERFDRRIQELVREKAALLKTIVEAQSLNEPPPPALDAERVSVYLADMQELLNQEIPAAAEAIRQVTGPIKITHEPYTTGRPGARWFAEFSPDFRYLLAQLARKKDYPDALALEYLCRRIWISPTKTVVKIEEPQKHELLTDQIIKMHKAGASVDIIARKLNSSWLTVKNALRIAAGGQFVRYARKPKNKANAGDAGKKPLPRVPKYIALAPEVARLRDINNLDFESIAKAKGVNVSTARHAYYHAHPEIIERAVAGGSPGSGKRSRNGDPVGRRRSRIDDDPLFGPI